MPSVVGDFEIASLSADSGGHGLAISIAATSSPGTTLHTAASGTTSWDYVFLYVANRDTVAHTVYVEWGSTDAEDRFPIELPPGSGPQRVFEDARMLRNGLVIRAYADAADKVSAWGEVYTMRRSVS